MKILSWKNLNNTVNNWGIDLSSFKIFFQHIKGKHDVMADALSRLKRKSLYEAQGLEPEGYEFRHTIMEKLPPVKVYNITVPPKPVQGSQDIAPKQNSDKFCIEVKENLNLPKFSDYKVGG